MRESIDRKLTQTEALYEACRCLQCHNAPCTEACPAHIPIPRFMRMLKSGNFFGGAEVIKSANIMANICGRVCPSEMFCQKACIRQKIDSPVEIRLVHEFLTTEEAERGFSRPVLADTTKGQVAVVGAGPAGLSCAFELRKLGYNVTVYESRAEIAGVPGVSIPRERLQDEDIHRDTSFLSSHLSDIRLSATAISISDLVAKTDAVFLATGLGRDKRLNIPGEDLDGVMYAMDFLELCRAQPGKLEDLGQVLVVGGGNVALDAATSAMELGASVVCVVCLEKADEIPAYKRELDWARDHGCQIYNCWGPQEMVGASGRVREVLFKRCTRVFDEEGRFDPQYDESQTISLKTDTVVVAIGRTESTSVDLDVRRLPSGYIEVDDQLMTSVPGVFAGGDLIRPNGTIVQAVADGKKAAWGIHQFLQR